MSIVVVFPAPLGPSKATVEPRSRVRSGPRTARTAPKDFSNPCVTMLFRGDAAGEESVTKVLECDRRYASKVLESVWTITRGAENARTTWLDA